MGSIAGADEAYFDTRLAYDERRRVLWETLWEEVFSDYVEPGDTVVELGAGWCDFINAVRSERRVAVDLWDGISRVAAPGVECHVGPADDLGFLGDDSVDLILASNLLEHLERPAIAHLLGEVRRVLRPGGRLILVQPNFRLCAPNYFDDYTHVSVWSDVGMSEYLRAQGMQVELVQGRFLPFSLKSRLPVSKALIRAYLRSPVKPRAGQMLIVAAEPA
jgi:ubiquinone/menaquinone biosynthesis C-methylase UbiE